MTKRLDGTVQGLFPCGTTGEFASLGHEQRIQVIETVATVAEETPVLAGCCGSSIVEVTNQINEVAEMDIDAAVVVTPYYFNTSDKGLSDFFTAVADQSEIPIFLYTIPVLTGTPLSVNAVEKLADHDRIVGIKATTPNLVYIQSLIQRTPSSFVVLQGSTAYGIASLDIGAGGFVSGESNVIPTQLVTLYDAYQSGSRDQALDSWINAVLPFVSLIDDMPIVPAIKYVLSFLLVFLLDQLSPLFQNSQQHSDNS